MPILRIEYVKKKRRCRLVEDPWITDLYDTIEAQQQEIEKLKIQANIWKTEFFKNNEDWKQMYEKLEAMYDTQFRENKALQTILKHANETIKGLIGGGLDD